MVPMKKIILLVFSLCLAVCVCIAVAEFYLARINYVPYQSPWNFVHTKNGTKKMSRLYVVDPRRIYKMRNGVYTSDIQATDAQGYRYASHATSDTDQITIFGDSFTYAEGVKHWETYPYFLEKLLHAENMPVSVNNAGVSGYGPDQVYVYVQELLKTSHPKLIVWTVNMNDVDDSDEACLIIPISQTLITFPGWLNSLYIQGSLLEHLPVSVTNLRVTNLALFAFNRMSYRGRFTPLCTGMLSRAQRLKKIQLLVRIANKHITARGEKLLVVLAPFQYYFDMNKENDRHEIIGYRKLAKGLQETGAEFFDSNENMARTYFPLLYDLRIEKPSTSSGQTEIVSTQDFGNPAVDLFRNEEEKMWDFGWRHPNPQGYFLWASTVYEKINNMSL